MKVIYPNMDFKEDPVLTLGFENLDTSDTDNVVLHIDGYFDNGYCDFEKEPGKKYYCLDFELPNNFWVGPRKHATIQIYENKYDKIFTICPHTAKIRNRVLGREQYEYVYYPTPDTWDRENTKEYDICYFGNNSGIVLNESILKHNHVVVNQGGGPYCNRRGVSFQEKMDIISKSRITVVHNILIFHGPKDENFFDVREEKFGFGTVTQHKSRVVEAARCKSLILCREDDFNIIEDWLTPNEDFLYYNNENFEQIVDDVLQNYEKYQPMIEKAYNKVKNNCGTINFYNDYIKSKQ
jgi:hypothetical protein